MDINIDLSNINNLILPHFKELLTDKSQYLIMRGGAGSGKTVFVILKLLTRIIGNWKRKYRFYVIMKTESSMSNTVYAEFEKWIRKLNLHHICRIYKSPKFIEFFNGSKVIFIGCDQPDKLLGLSDADGVWIEEASRITKNDFEYIDTRTRGVIGTYGQTILTFNPISKLNWIYSYFYVNKVDGAKLHHSVVRDNEFLKKIDPGYLKKIDNFKNTNKNKWKTFWLGEWGSLEGAVYSNYDYIDIFPDNFDDVFYGLDFGFTNPSALVKVGKKDGEYYLEEKIYKPGLTNSELIREVKKAIPEEERRKVFVYCDSAEPDRIREFVQAGFYAKKAEKSKDAGITYCQDQKLHIHKDSYNLQKEIEGYVYMTDKDGNPTEIPIKDMDHLLDSTRYALFTHSRPRPKFKILFGDED